MKKMHPWVDRMQGARKMLHFLNDQGLIDLVPGIPKKRGKTVYHDAVFNWLMSDLSNIETYLSGVSLRFYDFENDAEGRLVNCKVKEDNNRSLNK